MIRLDIKDSLYGKKIKLCQSRAKSDNMEVNLEGKIRNLPDFKDHALLPVFEAIINSAHAIEDRKNGRGQINLTIIREPDAPTTLEQFFDQEANANKSRGLPEIKDFIIEDNGIGFTDENFESFNTSDSVYKKERGGKGIGRFSWLKAFDKVEIESIFEENGLRKKRIFDFTTKSKTGIDEKPLIITDEEIKTTIKLLGFKKGYQNNPSAYKTTSKIAQRILEHFLSYYIAGSIPKIIIEDKFIKSPNIDLDDEYNAIKTNITTESFSIKNEKFTIYHVELPQTKKDVHQIVYCANGRDVKSINLNNLLGSSAFLKNGQKIYYAAYILSNYLTNHVDNLRRDIELPKIDYEGIDGTYEISESTIKNEIINRIKIFLSDYLSEVKEKKKEQVSNILLDNPGLKSVVFHYPEIYDEIKIGSSDEQTTELLYKLKGRSTYQIQEEYKESLKTQIESYEEIKKQCKEIFEKLEPYQKDNLTDYIVWRQKVIQFLDEKLKSNKLHKHEKEDIIHDLIFPRKTTTDSIDFDNVNLWLIDDQLIFHKFAASDIELKKFKEYSDSDSDLRPDIIIFSKGEDNQASDEISIFELKRPMRKRVEKEPISYMYDIIEQIKKRQKKRDDDRFILTNDNTRFYCYAICDFLGDIEKMTRDHQMKQLNYNLGYYTFHSGLNAHVWLLTFDELLKTAKRRNAVFFDKLGIKPI